MTAVKPQGVRSGRAWYRETVPVSGGVLVDLLAELEELRDSLVSQGVTPEDITVDITTGVEFGDPWADLEIEATRLATAEDLAAAEQHKQQTAAEQLAAARARVAELERYVQSEADGV